MFTLLRDRLYLPEISMSESHLLVHSALRHSCGHDHVERGVRSDLVAGDRAGAVARVVGVYGREIFGFLSATLGGRQRGRDAYARFVEALPIELPRFAWQCRLRTFVYFVACRELQAMRNAPALVLISVTTARELGEPPGQRRRGVIAAVRRCLTPEDRALLVLHFGRGFSWREIALIALGEHAAERDIVAKSEELHRHLSILRMQVELLTNRVSGPRAIRQA